jgi:hypothetical protein
MSHDPGGGLRSDWPEAVMLFEEFLIAALDHQADLVVKSHHCDLEDFVTKFGRVADPGHRSGVLIKKFAVAPMPHFELDGGSGFYRSAALRIIEASEGFEIFYSNEAHHGSEPFFHCGDR